MVKKPSVESVPIFPNLVKNITLQANNAHLQNQTSLFI